MSCINQRLFLPQQLTNIAAVYYTAVARTQVTAMLLVNPSASVSYPATLYWVPSGAAVDPSNIVLPARPILPGESFVVFPFIGQTLAIGDSIWAVAGTTLALNFMASGTLMT